MDNQLLIWILISFDLTTIFLGLGFLLIGKTAFSKTETGAAKSFRLLLKDSKFLQMTTVVLVINAAFTLALLKYISGEAIIAILSAIVGYVLGGMHAKKNETE